jgi:hypothetical protein
MKPVPENMSCSFTVDDQWYTTTMRDMFALTDETTPAGGERLTNRELLAVMEQRGWEFQRFDNFIHIRPPA